MDSWSNVKISQLKGHDGKYDYRIEINGAQEFSTVNESAKSWMNVRVYNSGPWHAAAKVIIKNLTIDTKPEY